MAVTAVHRAIKDALNYAVNPEKTENPNEEELRRLMDYAENPDKTKQRYLISGVNCLPELAYERMMETKRRYGKYGGIVAYHGYMSFKHDEVTPEQCHALGVELAKRFDCGETSMRCSLQVTEITSICTTTIIRVARRFMRFGSVVRNTISTTP